MKRNYEAKLALINQNPEDKAMKLDAMRQHYQTILGDIPDEELEAKINQELDQYRTIDGNYEYKSNTSNEDEKYTTELNQNFYKLSKAKKEKYILKLWRTLFNKTRGCNLVINQFQAINTKLAYFGRQLLAYDQIEQKNKELEVK